jgi:hypothetical protein
LFGHRAPTAIAPSPRRISDDQRTTIDACQVELRLKKNDFALRLTLSLSAVQELRRQLDAQAGEGDSALDLPEPDAQGLFLTEEGAESSTQAAALSLPALRAALGKEVELVTQAAALWNDETISGTFPTSLVPAAQRFASSHEATMHQVLLVL